jgi:hypothetical protein
MATVDGGNVRHITAVVVTAANNLIIEQRLHPKNTIPKGPRIKGKLCRQT